MNEEPSLPEELKPMFTTTNQLIERLGRAAYIRGYQDGYDRGRDEGFTHGYEERAKDAWLATEGELP